MEDALVLMNIFSSLRQYAGLNPCFNGRCTRTINNFINADLSACLNPCFNGRCTRTRSSSTDTTTASSVLILVLMEDALVQGYKD